MAPAISPPHKKDENNWLRSWTHETYLWYSEVTDVDPNLYSTPAYFDLMKTFATTPSGKDKDRFHFTYSTADWIALSQAGEDVGYGVQWAITQTLPTQLPGCSVSDDFANELGDVSESMLFAALSYMRSGGALVADP